MKAQVFFYLVILLILAACGKNKQPGLSDKELFAQKETTDTLRQELTDFYADNYVVPPGIKYTESRAVDPANPPVVLDIANRKLNIRKFDLSDYYTKVRYIKLKHPMPPKEGNFLFETELSVTYDRGLLGGQANSTFSFLKDSIIAGDVYFGYHSYDYEGNFLNTLKTYDFPKVYDVSKNEISFYSGDFDRVRNEATKNSGRRRVDDKTLASYVYNRMDTLSNDFLFTFSLKGDTLCRFKNYNPKPDPNKKGLLISWSYPSRIYFYEGKLTVGQAFSDTIYRMTAPNCLVPVYVLKFGSHKLDISLAEDFSNKFFPDIWKETGKYILFSYNKDRDSPNNRTNGIVKFFYSYYDKRSRQFYHFCEETNTPKQEFFIENSVPDALPFILSSVEIAENQLYAFYSKRRLENIIKNKGFASLSPEQQDKVKTMQNELGESEVLIMILDP